MNYKIRTDLDNYGVTVKEVADELGISVSTFYRWCTGQHKDWREKEDLILEAIRAVSSQKYN